MITVENDWVTYEPQAVRPMAVRGGAACAQRPRTVTQRPAPVAPARSTAPSRPGVARIAQPGLPQPRRAPERRLRLTRRGRVVLIVLPAVLAGTAALVSLTGPFAEAQPVRPTATVVVGTGDTLWSIAERIAPRADPRDVVADLEQANHLGGAAVQAGQRLRLPVGLSG